MHLGHVGEGGDGEESGLKGEKRAECTNWLKSCEWRTRRFGGSTSSKICRQLSRASSNGKTIIGYHGEFKQAFSEW